MIRHQSITRFCIVGFSLFALRGGAQEKPTPNPAEKTETTGSASAKVLQINLAFSGDFAYRFVTKDQAPQAPAPLPTGIGGKVALPLPANIKPNESEIEIYDNTRGNLARFTVLTNKPLSLVESAFRFVQVVYVPVQSKGKAVTDVQVTMTSANKRYRQTWMLKPADSGVARFENAPLDEPVTITVSYSANPPKSAIETLPRAHPADGHRREPLLVDWADVKTVNATPLSPTAMPSQTNAAPVSAPSAPQPSSGNPFIGTLLGLAVLGGIGYAVYHNYQNGKIKLVLERLGVQTAPIAEDPAAPNPFTKTATAPITPITEGTADPFGAGGASPAPAAYVSPAGGARFVGTMGVYAGSIFTLSEAQVIIGRDPANGIPLPNDTNASRRHATLESAQGAYVIYDNGSSNGTFVNGVKIATGTPQSLRPGDEVQIGMTRFRFEA